MVQGLFNFRPAVRPVPLEAHIQGYPGKFYCPRMATMNKPAYAAVQSHSPAKPVLVFVSSRRQTRLTALDLIAFAAADMKPSQWVHMPEHDLEQVPLPLPPRPHAHGRRLTVRRVRSSGCMHACIATLSRACGGGGARRVRLVARHVPHPGRVRTGYTTVFLSSGSVSTRNYA